MWYTVENSDTASVNDMDAKLDPLNSFDSVQSKPLKLKATHKQAPTNK